jgi:hypothetical protein
MSHNSIDTITAALDEFRSSDDNDYRLNVVLRNFKAVENPECALPSMFALLERFPNSDFGSPGSLVHTIEHVTGYCEQLKQSLSRRPTVYTVWMVNRIMNTTEGDDWSGWMRELHRVLSHPLADDGVRENARRFVEFQNERIET